MVDSNISSSETFSLSYSHNKSPIPFEYKTVAQSFDELANQYPDYECYIFKGEHKRYTYAALKYDVDCIAKSLFELGFQNNDCLAVCLPNSSENVVLGYVASKLGIIKVHIDPSSVARELSYELSRIRCKGIVLTANNKILKTLNEALSNLGNVSLDNMSTPEHIILIGSNEEIPITYMQSAHSYDDLIKRGSLRNAEKDDLFSKHVLSIDPNTPLSILFTSGSTGYPKPVILTNRAIMNSTKMLSNHFGPFCLRYCAPLSMVHISSGIRGIFLPSEARCTVIIPSQTHDTIAIMRAIDEEKCTCMMAGPALFHSILAHPERHKYNMISLQYVTLSGTSIQPEFLRKLEIELGIGRMGQVYGMTESASLLTSSLFAELKDNRRHTSIGQCMPHIELKLVDDNGMTVPIGVQGEIWARGYSIMRGYYNDSENTAKTITNDGWLHTGDLATMDQDGYFYFMGRKKDIIIGHLGNVYPIEIEMVVGQHPSVSEVHVFSIPNDFTDAEICAFVKLKPTTTCEVNELKSFLEDRLTSYKIPEHIRFVDEFPRTSTGKVSKLKLAEIMLKENNIIT